MPGCFGAAQPREQEVPPPSAMAAPWLTLWRRAGAWHEAVAGAMI